MIAFAIPLIIFILWFVFYFVISMGAGLIIESFVNSIYNLMIERYLTEGIEPAFIKPDLITFMMIITVIYIVMTYIPILDSIAKMIAASGWSLVFTYVAATYLYEELPEFEYSCFGYACTELAFNGPITLRLIFVGLFIILLAIIMLIYHLQKRDSFIIRKIFIEGAENRREKKEKQRQEELLERSRKEHAETIEKNKPIQTEAYNRYMKEISEILGYYMQWERTYDIPSIYMEKIINMRSAWMDMEPYIRNYTPTGENSDVFNGVFSIREEMVRTYNLILPSINTFSHKQQQQNTYQNQNRNQSQNQGSSTSSSNWFAGCKTKEDLENRYKSLAKMYHPDNSTGVSDIFKQILEEYENKTKQFS